jgi:cyclopropane-fatty-acyl-phospholipid synthase
VLLRGSRGLADAYERGMWDSPDLVALIRLGALNAARLDRVRTRLTPLSMPARMIRAIVRRSTRGRRRRDIAAHYDLGTDLFERMLDPTLSYSCAVFEHDHATLEQAQIAKLERVCEKLDLGPDDRLLEIGTGWGALAVHAATTRGCHVTTTTISREQYDHAVSLVKRAGLADRVTVLMEDYRDLAGSYDKLVSIEMIEAVGWEYLDGFFERCAGLLAADGLMFLQAITIDDRAYEGEKSGRSFANTLIFPGGCLPSLGAMQRSVARRTDLRAVFLEDIGPSYALTLRHWRARFGAASEQLEELGYDDRFRRLWRLYLTLSEAGFMETRLRDLQIVFAKSGARWVTAAASGSSASNPSNAAIPALPG